MTNTLFSLLFALLIVLPMNGFAQTALGTLANSLQPGQWAELPTSGMNAAFLNTGGGSNITNAYAMNMAWDSVRQIAHFIGKDHGPTALTRHVQFRATTNDWISGRPSWFVNPGGAYNDSHGYHLIASNSAGRKLYRLPVGGNTVRVFNLDADDTTNAANWTTLPSIPIGNYSPHAIEYFPERNELVVLTVGVDAAWIFSEATQTWTRAATPLGLASTWVWAVYNPVLHECLLGSSTNKLWIYSAAGTWTQKSVVTITHRTYNGTGFNGLWTVDPVSGKYLLVTDPTNGTGRNVYQYDSAANTYALAPTQLPDKKLGGNFVATPLPEYGVTMWAWAVGPGGGSTGAYLYKSNAAPPPNMPPAVSAGLDQAITLPASANVVGTASDDGLPAALTTAWSALGGPGTVTFGNVNALSTAASFSAAGTYTLRLTATDTALSISDDAIIVVNPANVAPLVNAGSDQMVSEFWSVFTLSGSAMDDPAQALTYQWEMISGPGTSVFANPNAATTSVIVNAAGTYEFKLVASDGLISTSDEVTVVVSSPIASNPVPPPPNPDAFVVRCAQPGVVKCVGFDQASDVSGRYGQPNGLLASNTGTFPVLDTTVKASGNSSLKFTIPVRSGADAAGSYFTNFSNDFSVQFDGGDTFYYQWRQRFSLEFLNTKFPPVDGAWKQAIVGTGSTGNNVGWPGIASSCSALELVVVGGITKNFPHMYNSCTGSASHGPYWPFEEPYGPNDFKLENARPSPYCLYSQKFTGYFPPTGNCFKYFPDEWMTFQVGVTLGPRMGDEFVGSRIQMWGAREGQALELIFDKLSFNLSAGPITAKPLQRFGQIFLTPYMTNKDAAVTNPIAYTWYDELIISRRPIA